MAGGLLWLDELFLIALHLVEHERRVRVGHTDLLTRVYDVLEILASVVCHLGELTLASWSASELGAGCACPWDIQSVDAALNVLMHRAVTARRSRHSSSVHPA